MFWFRSEVARFHVRGLKTRFKQAAELGAIRDHVRPDSIVCDVGAYKGSYLYWLSRWCRNGKVFAFEPLSDFADSLTDICANQSNVTIEELAVSNSSGIRTIYVPIDHPQGASLVKDDQTMGPCTMRQIQSVSLDDYFSNEEQIALLKVDVEGTELDVFKGAAQILLRQSPLLVFECESRHLRKTQTSMSEVFLYLRSLGYEGHFVLRNRVLPLCAFDPMKHQREDGEAYWNNKDYCNNFIFKKTRH